MRTTVVDGKVQYETLVREDRVQEAFKAFCQQCLEYRGLSDKAQAAFDAAEALSAAIAGDADAATAEK